MLDVIHGMYATQMHSLIFILYQRPHVDDEPARRAGEEETWGLLKNVKPFFRHTDAVKVFQNIQMPKIRTEINFPLF